MLYGRLADLHEKKSEIITQNQQRGTPKEERERLLKQVRLLMQEEIDDNSLKDVTDGKTPPRAVHISTLFLNNNLLVYKKNKLFEKLIIIDYIHNVTAH